MSICPTPPQPPKIERLQFNSVYIEHQTSCLNLHPIDIYIYLYNFIYNWYIRIYIYLHIFCLRLFPVRFTHFTLLLGSDFEPLLLGIGGIRGLQKGEPVNQGMSNPTAASLRVHWFWTTSNDFLTNVAQVDDCFKDHPFVTFVDGQLEWLRELYNSKVWETTECIFMVFSASRKKQNPKLKL